jgi:dihydrodipicolinate synthase/N-acetylneuraminate lyase
VERGDRLAMGVGYHLLGGEKARAACSGVGRLTAGLALRGGSGGSPRAPLMAPDADGVEEIRETLAAVGLCSLVAQREPRREAGDR